MSHTSWVEVQHVVAETIASHASGVRDLGQRQERDGRWREINFANFAASRAAVRLSASCASLAGA